MALSISMTTRPPRPREIDGKSYFFVTEDAFLQTQREGGLLEHAFVYGNYYGTPRSMVEEARLAGRDVVLEIDIQGALQIKQSCPDAVFIFILPPTMEELRKRITSRRSETAESINLRLGEALKEISQIVEYDYFVVNDVLSEAVHRIAAIIKSEHSRVTETVHDRIKKYQEEL